MTQDQIIQLISVLVPCVIALLVGYWHRKQMRQIELFRQDPSVGVRPPPSPPVAFFKRYWDLILGIALPILNLALLIITNQPVTVAWVVIISVNVATIYYTLALRSELRLLKIINTMIDTQKITTNTLSKTVDALYDQAKFSSAIVKGNEVQARLSELQQQRLKEIEDAGTAKPKGE